MQQNGDISIKYITEKNDDVFNSIVQVNGVNIGVGTGINKKLAEQQAAKSAMKKKNNRTKSRICVLNVIILFLIEDKSQIVLMKRFDFSK